MRKILSVLTSVKCVDILLISAWVHGGLLYFVSIALELITGNKSIGPFFFLIYYAFLFICSYRHWIKKIQGKDLWLVVVLALVVLFSYSINVPNQENILENSKDLFAQVIPFYFVGIMMGHRKQKFDLLYLGSVSVVIVNWLYVFVILATGRQMQEDNLAISYSVLPHALMLIWYALEKRTLKTISVAALGALFIFAMGSRGPVLSCVVFGIIYYLTSDRYSKKQKAAVVCSLLLVGIIVVQTGFLENMLLWIRNIIVEMNLSPRVIDAVLYGSATGSDEERQQIYRIVWGYIEQKPLLGYGIYGEWSMVNYYAHQMILELWAHYGVIIGTFLLFMGAKIIYDGYRKSPNHYARVFVLLLISFGVVRGIYAGSYLSYYMFLLIGYCVSNIRLHRKHESGRRLKNDD